MRKKKLAILTFLVGGMLALAIVFSQFIRYSLFPSTLHVSIEQKEYQSLKAADIYNPSPAVSISSFSLPAPFHIQSNFNPCFLFEIFFEQNFDEDYIEEPSLHPDVFFEIMFRLIISPNAP